ncbi:MAG TPA: ankyrin repeat domain-containing protein [Gammaproteobacteria bacterium]
MALVALLLAAPGWPASSDLAEAARRGDLAAVRALLDSGAGAGDVDAPGPDGMTALLWACQANDIALARALLAAGADPDVPNRYGITPLWLAAINGSAPLAELLLEHGADVDGALPHGETPLMAAARAGDAATIRLLLAAGADPNASETSLGETGLMWAAAEDHADAIRALVEGGADPDAHSRVLDLLPMNWEQTGMVSTVLPSGGWTALMLAARQDARAAARALVEMGADLDAQDPDGTTALAIAIMNAHYDLAAELLEAGADPNVADRTGMNALYAAVDVATLGREIGRPERPNMNERDAHDLVRLTLAHGADPNAQLTEPIIPRHHAFPDRSLGAGTTPLMRAARGLDVDAMRILLEAGADATLTQADGATVLFSLAGARRPFVGGVGDVDSEGAREAMRLLLDAGVDVNARGPGGQTVLHRAARLGNAAVVKLLAENGARLDARDDEGRTALDIVSAPGRAFNESMADLLRRLAEPQ